MNEKVVSYGVRPRALVGIALVAVAVSFVGCSSHEGGIDVPGSSGAGGGDSDVDAATEAGEAAGSTDQAESGADEDAAFDASLITPDDATGTPDPEDAATRASCVFHTPPSVAMDAAAPEPEASVTPPSSEAGAESDGSAEAGRVSDAGSASDARPREGGTSDAGPPGDVTVEMSGFSYLADTAGRALYIYAADIPGDCEQAPVSTCEADCLISWPIFDAKKRRLAPGLNDDLFGTIRRADGTEQTTYRGWPLYYFKTDLVKGQVTGQGRSKVWFLATVLAPGITIMKTGPDKRLADGSGHTVYAYDHDVKGGELTDPVSACTGPCTDGYPPVLQNRISVVASLEPSDFSLFLRPGTSRLQLVYKGAPLYYAAGDGRPGDMNGVTPGWSVVAP